MLNRHHLRVKTLHALYAQFSLDQTELVKGEKELLKSIDKYYELYISSLSLFEEFYKIAVKIIDDGKQKFVPTQADLNPNLKFINNKVLLLIISNSKLQNFKKHYKISWDNYNDTLRKLFNTIRSSDTYKEYMAQANTSFAEDRKFLVDLYATFIANNELIEHIFEDDSILWVDDFYMAHVTVVKTIENLKETTPADFTLQPLYKDAEDDKAFVLQLFKNSIAQSEDLLELIKSKIKNWEIDRIASMDILLMKMCLTEMMTFSQIPVKVSLNEYIELAKSYSTPKSKGFINGILDPLIEQLKNDKKIVKTGRGLLE